MPAPGGGTTSTSGKGADAKSSSTNSRGGGPSFGPTAMKAAATINNIRSKGLGPAIPPGTGPMVSPGETSQYYDAVDRGNQLVSEQLDNSPTLP